MGVATRAGNPGSQFPMLIYWEYDLIDYLAHSLTSNKWGRLQQMLFANRIADNTETNTPLADPAQTVLRWATSRRPTAKR